MAADGAGRAARRIHQHGVERAGLPVLGGGGDGGRRQAEPVEVLAQPAEPGRGAVDRGDRRARRRQLGGLAARRRAEVGGGAAGEVAEQPRRQRRGGILDPPGAFPIAGHGGDRAMGGKPHRAGRQDDAAELRRPALRIGLDGEVERRFQAVGPGDGMGGLGAIGPGPARQQPFRGVEIERLEPGEHRGALAAGDPAQHRIDEAGIAVVAAIGLDQAHRQVDRGVVGHVEEQDLGGAGEQRGFDPGRLARAARG